MPKINVMPKSLAELIAAGEVVERPASAVKELLENAIDAGAKNITLEIKNGGITYIRISDNGCGIAPEDVRTAFISHATSKIATAEDLDSILTLGFRGEALPSIAAVSKVELLTRTAGADTGTRYVTEYGEEVLMDEAGCPLGTTITVRDIFQKTPARMKFLKKDVTEANAVAAVIDRTALSHPELSFRFIREGKQVLMTSGSGDLLTCIREVLGKEFASQLIPCENETNGVRVKGFISMPVYSRPNRNMQYFFLNGRFVKTGTGSAAVSEGYRNSIMVGKFPACVLNIEINPNLVDVNVHPAKTEIRFSDEKPVFNAVFGACKNALAISDTPKQVTSIGNRDELIKHYTEKPLTPAEQLKIPVSSSQEKKPGFWQTQSADVFRAEIKNEPVTQAENISEPVKNDAPERFVPKNTAPVRTTVTAAQPRDILPEKEESIDDILLGSYKKKPAIDIFVEDDEEKGPVIQPEPETKESANPVPVDSEGFSEDKFRLIGEAFMTYIICEYDKKLIIIDKHAAHERIIYERLKRDNGDRSPQVLLMPVTVNLSKEEYSAVLENTELINSSGFNVEDFGSGCVIVTECPMELSVDDIQDVITEIAGRLADSRQDVMFEKLDWIFHSVACRSAIKAGNYTSTFEMEKFAKQLLSMPDIRYCPHGRPVLIEMTQRELEKNFGRIV